MPQVADRRARTPASLWAAMRSFDWGLVLLVAVGALTLFQIAGARGYSGSPWHWLSRSLAVDPFAAYEAALVASAVKRPNYRKTLKTLDSPMVNAVTFRAPRDLDLTGRSFDIWVALADELREACRGAADPVRKLQQVLGLPPVAAATHVVTELEVPRDGLFRPCLGRDTSVQTPTCDFRLPDPPPKETDATALRKAYDELRFGTEQLWTRYRSGFPSDRRGPSDYPYTGYPFTGMGWSYDWGDSSRGHFGVSEFVVTRDAEIKIRGEQTPAEFCGKPG